MQEIPQVTLSYTERHVFMSETIGDTFTINVALPKQYDPANTRYPVVYLTDANIFFGLVAETAWLLQYGKEIPEIILVAIGYPDDTQHLTLRQRDLGPTSYGEPEPVGRAADFLAFIRNELKPFIARNYSVNLNDSTLIGDSTGGLFALYLLFNTPKNFSAISLEVHRYIGIIPLFSTMKTPMHKIIPPYQPQCFYPLVS